MDTFNTWWQGLTALNHCFFYGAAVFSVVFLWQMVMALMGLGGHDVDVDSHVETTDVHHTPDDADQSMAVFKLLSVRSILSFFTLFTWAGGLYMSRDIPVFQSLVYAVAWGLAAMVVVSSLLFLMRKLSETGNIKVSSCVGTSGTVYLDVPAGGMGEIRVLCSGVMTHLKARCASGGALKAGAQIRVTNVLDANTVEVEPVESSK